MQRKDEELAGLIEIAQPHVDEAVRLVKAQHRHFRRRARMFMCMAVAALLASTLRLALVAAGSELGQLTAYEIMVWAGVLAAGAHGLVGGLEHYRHSTNTLHRLLTLLFLRSVLLRSDAPHAILVGKTARMATPEAWVQNWLVSRRPRQSASRPKANFSGTGMRRLLAVTLLLGALMILSRSTEPHESELTFTFTERVEDPRLLGLSVSTTPAGTWLLDEHPGATGNRALVNRVGARGAGAATAVIEHARASDIHASTRCKFGTSLSEQACGLAFRYVDEQQYYVARADALEQAVLLVLVQAGSERIIGRQAAPITANRWYDLNVDAQADRLRVSLNQDLVLDVRDPTIAGPGRVGLWVPAECEAYFDELTFRAALYPQVSVAPTS